MAWLVGKIVLWLVPDPHWPRFDDRDVEGMRVSTIRSDALELEWGGTKFLLLAAR